MTTPVHATRPFVDGKGALTPFGRSILDSMRTATGGATPIIPGNIAFKNLDETIAGLWEFTQRPTSDGVKLASINELPQLFNTRADVASATVPAAWDFVATSGHTAAGDGGAALYKRVAAEPTHDFKVSSNGGTVWWEGQPQGGRVDVRQFGALCDGSTVDTSAVTSAVNYAITNTENDVHIVGDCVFDPTFLASVTLTSPLTIYVNGTLRPTTTIAYSAPINIIGLGGTTGPQFSNPPMCSIIPVTGAPTIRITDAGRTRLLRGISIQNSDNIAIQIKVLGPGAICANVMLEHVGASITSAGTAALQIDNAFWIWARDCAFLGDASGGYAVEILATSTSSYAGILEFENIRMSPKGVKIGGTGTAQEIVDIRLKQVVLENAITGLVDIDVDNLVSLDHLLLEDSTIADGASATHQINISGSLSNTSRIKDVRWKGPTLVPILNRAVREFYAPTTRAHPNAGAFELGPLSPGSMAMTDGVIEGEWDGNGALVGPSATPYAAMAIPQDVSTWGALTGTATVTTGVRAPDGSTTAATLSSSSGTQEKRLFDGALSSAIDDWFIAGFWTASTGAWIHDRSIIQLTGAGAAWESGGSTLGFGERLSTVRSDLGWHYVVILGKVAAAGTGFRYSLRVDTGKDASFWMPSCVHIPASAGLRDAEVRRIARQLVNVKSSQMVGVAQMFPHQTLLTGKGATADRPSGTLPAGGQWFDTSLGKPIWADGSGGWVDAAGTAV